MYRNALNQLSKTPEISIFNLITMGFEPPILPMYRNALNQLS